MIAHISKSKMAEPGETLLKLLRSFLRGKMDEQHNLTAQSTLYRQKAAALAREAEGKPDLAEQIELVKRALQWIHLAENEELLAESDTSSKVIDFPPKL